MKVQRDFLAAALHQWASVKNAYKLPSAIRLITEHTKTDLTSAQLAWLAESAALCGTDGLTMATMPGSAAWIGGGSYYVLDAAQVADLVNEKLNPYQKEVTALDLASSTALVGDPCWSHTTLTSSCDSARRSIVLTKFFP